MSRNVEIAIELFGEEGAWIHPMTLYRRLAEGIVRSSFIMQPSIVFQGELETDDYVFLIDAKDRVLPKLSLSLLDTAAENIATSAYSVDNRVGVDRSYDRLEYLAGLYSRVVLGMPKVEIDTTD